MLNDLTFLESLYQVGQFDLPVRFLITGDDAVIRNAFLKKILEQSRKKNQSVIVVDDSDDVMFDFDVAKNTGYVVKNGMSEGCCLYKLFPINMKKNLLQLREILKVLEFSEEKKSKLNAFFEFVNYFESVFYRNDSGDIYLETLAEYGSSIQVDMKLYSLMKQGVIDGTQREYFQGKYSEVSSAGADFEHALLLLEPLITGQTVSLKTNDAIVYSISKFDGDPTVKSLVISLLLNYVREHRNDNFLVLIMDKGHGERNSLYEFVNRFPTDVEAHIFSGDIFTLCNESNRGNVFNRFQMRIYGRHLSETSCEAVSIECGEIDVTKTAYAVSYDRRWKANKPIDILMGNNKQEVYTTASPVREPRYRKEMVAEFFAGTGIAQYKGQTLLFSL